MSKVNSPHSLEHVYDTQAELMREVSREITLNLGIDAATLLRGIIALKAGSADGSIAFEKDVRNIFFGMSVPEQGKAHLKLLRGVLEVLAPKYHTQSLTLPQRSAPLNNLLNPINNVDRINDAIGKVEDATRKYAAHCGKNPQAISSESTVADKAVQVLRTVVQAAREKNISFGDILDVYISIQSRSKSGLPNITGRYSPDERDTLFQCAKLLAETDGTLQSVENLAEQEALGCLGTHPEVCRAVNDLRDQLKAVTLKD